MPDWKKLAQAYKDATTKAIGVTLGGPIYGALSGDKGGSAIEKIKSVAEKTKKNPPTKKVYVGKGPHGRGIQLQEYIVESKPKTLQGKKTPEIPSTGRIKNLVQDANNDKSVIQNYGNGNSGDNDNSNNTGDISEDVYKGYGGG